MYYLYLVKIYKPKSCTLVSELNAMRKLNAKQACLLAFIVSDNVCIITIIPSDKGSYYPYQ